MPADLAAHAAVRAVANALLEAIRAAGPNGVPAGHMYAMVMDRMSLDSFEALIAALVGIGQVRRESSHLLVAIESEVAP
jgi:hypothetical protein